MRNPIERVREELNLSVKELAIIANVDAISIRRLERGDASKLSGKVLTALVSLGYDKNEVVIEYSQWRQEKSQLIRSGLSK